MRKISVVSPGAHGIYSSPFTGIDVFFAGGGPTGTGTQNQNSSLLEVIGNENAKLCDDIKDWWSNILESR